MKRLLTGALALLISVAASATTLNPVQLLNPTGSSSGQAIVSTGASSAPAWGNVPVANVTGAAALTGATFTGDVTISKTTPNFNISDTSGGSGQARVNLQNNGANEWALVLNSSTNQFVINRYVSGSLADGAIAISNSTGIVTMPDGIISSPISGSTGSFTTLAASSTVSGTGFSTYLASPPAIGTTTPAAGKFTTLQATSTITPSSTAGIVGTATNDNANAGSVGEYVTNTTTGTSLTTNINANATSISLTAGDWDVSGICIYHPAASTQIVDVFAGITTTSATAGPTGTITNMVWPGFVPGATSIYLTSPTVRISLATTTTVYLLAQGAFTVSTETVDGFIRARRVR